MSGQSVEIIEGTAYTFRPGDRVLVSMSLKGWTAEQGAKFKNLLDSKFPGVEFMFLDGYVAGVMPAEPHTFVLAMTVHEGRTFCRENGIQPYARTTHIITGEGAARGRQLRPGDVVHTASSRLPKSLEEAWEVVVTSSPEWLAWMR